MLQAKPLFFFCSVPLDALGLLLPIVSLLHCLFCCSLLQDVLEGSNLRGPLQELHQMVMTPIKALSGSEEASLQRPLLSPGDKNAAPGSHLTGGGGNGEAESGTSIIAEGDLPGQFTRAMGKGKLQAPVFRWDRFIG